MPLLTITNRDLLASKIVEPAWYVVKVEDVEEKTSKAGTSQNFFIIGTIEKNADNGSTEFAGVPTPPRGWVFNEQYPGNAIGFINSLRPDNPITGEERVELADAKGSRLEVFIGNGTFDGKTVNTIIHQYRPLSEQNR